MEGINVAHMNTRNMVAKKSLQTVAEGDVIVPDIKPDIGKILEVEAEMMVHKTEVLQERVNVSGSVLFSVIYLPEEEGQNVKSIRTTQPFYHTEEVKEIGRAHV